MLTNLGRRKPRGLVTVYGERVLAYEADLTTSGRSTVFEALAAVIFRHLDREHSIDRALTVQLRPSIRMMTASDLDRSAEDGRSVSK